MKITTRRIAFAGILAAVYAVLTWLCQPLAYGAVQFRFSEALIVLCCFTPAAIPGMVVGCVAANIAPTLRFPVIDIVFGSLATLLASLLSHRETQEIGALLAELDGLRGAAFTRACERALRAIRALAEAQRPLWKNIL